MSNVARVDALQKEAEERIVIIRGCQVILDSDLAEFYGVPTGRLNKQAKDNEARFPEDFRFQLTQVEHDVLLFEIEYQDRGTEVAEPCLGPTPPRGR